MDKIKKFLNRVNKFIIRHKKVILIVLASFILLVSLAQLLWPRNLLLPFSRIAGESAGIFTDLEEVTNRAKDQVESATIKFVSAANAETKLSGEKILEVANISEGSFDSYFDYPLGWRFLPFSFVAFKADINQADLDLVDADRAHIAEVESQNLSRHPQNAVFAVDGEQVSVEESIDGVEVAAEAVEQELRDLRVELSGETILEVEGEVIKPDILTEDYEKLIPQAELAISRDIYFMLPTGSDFSRVDTTAAERARLLDVSPAEEGGYELTLKDDELAVIFNALEEEVRQEPGVTVVRTVNGEEVGRTEGSGGQGLQYQQYRDQLFERMFLKDSDERIDLVLRSIPPVIRFEREFTNSNEGLQSYLDSLAEDHNITVSVQQLSGNFWSASADGDKRMTSASTYKLFLAQFIINMVDSGQLSWNSSAMGTNVETCFEHMIIRSDNDCAEYWIKTYGSSNINRHLEALGYGQVFSNSGGPATTTTNNLNKILTSLYYNDNFSSRNAQKLKNLMSSQIFRQGIPAGSSHRVENKVGFLGSVLTDAGIVYHPEGVYVLSIMTEGEDWAKIAEITREVERIMYG